MMRCSCGLRAEKTTNSRTSSFAVVSSSTPRSPSARSASASVSSAKSRVDRRPPQLVLRAEVVVEQRLGDAGARCDLPCGRAVEGALGEQVERSSEDALRVGSADGRGWSGRCGRGGVDHACYLIK